jgi:crotonobetainyl-CoA:carnitine CoA-transferase CaiB-like acyl-CoA transferase
MYDMCAGVRVVELATWTFVPAAGAVLADWGADVIKIEHPVMGDPQRGLNASRRASPDPEMLTRGEPPPTSLRNVSDSNFPLMEVPNRGKRGMTLDVSRSEGLGVLYRLVQSADVFITNLRPSAVNKLKIDVDSLRAQNPRLIYARGSGYGPLGPEAEQAAFDLVATWTRAGMADKMTVDGDEPPVMPGSLGDLTSGLAMAGAIAAALFRRERTSIPAVVDVSLLATGMWFMSQSITGEPFGKEVEFQRHDRPRQPLVNFYRTKDHRWICLCMLQADRWWPDFCARVGRPDLCKSPKFMTHELRMTHLTECVEELDRLFAERTHDEWRVVLAGIEGPWALSQTAAEVRSDPQVIANGYLADAVRADGTTFKVVASPAQFDDASLGTIRASPNVGEHSEEILLEIGLSWDEIIELKLNDVVL